MQDLQKEMETVLSQEVVNRHSYFQLKYFVVEKEPTHQAKLWRCIRELQSRKETIDGLMVNLEDLRDELELVEIEIARIKLKKIDLSEEIPFVEREREIHLNKRLRAKKSIERNINSLEDRLHDAEEEAVFFLKSYQSLEKLEGLKPFDDFSSQQSYWNEKFTEEFTLRSLLGQPITFELAKSILSLNNDAPIKKQIVHTLEQKQKFIMAQLEEKE